MAFEEYIHQGGQKLRLGYTTGSCAALAAKAAALTLLSGEPAEISVLTTPRGLEVNVPVEEVAQGPGWASCAVRKDAGDDPDVTDGVLVYARVEKTDDSGLTIEGGEGVGRVTRPGLDQPVGEAAINRVPREMIAREVEAVCRQWGYSGGLRVTVSIPAGEALAAQTFNPRLGIEGGLSVLGTSGIVSPMSESALLGTIRAEMAMQAAEGAKKLILTPGNYGEAFISSYPDLPRWPYVKCSNFIGDALDMAREFGFETLLLVGHAGKLVKLAGGVMNTHSRVADCRLELVALHAALAGADRRQVQEVLAAVSVEEAVDRLTTAGLWAATLEGLLGEIQRHLEFRAAGAFEIGAVLFTNRHGFLGATRKAEAIIKEDNSNRKQEENA